MKYKVDNLGLYLKNIRQEKKYSLKDVSSKIGFSSGYISRIENNSSTPSLEVLMKLCSSYDIDIHTLVDDELIQLPIAENGSTFDIEQLLLNANSTYKGKPLHFSDKMKIVKFIELLTCEDEAVKDSYGNIINNLFDILNYNKKDGVKHE